MSLTPLSAVKTSFYSLSKQIKSIESRIGRLEEEEEKQKRKLDNLKNKNQMLGQIKTLKQERHSIKQKHSRQMINKVEFYKQNNKTMKTQHQQLIKGILDSLSSEKRTNFIQLKKQKKKNDQIIEQTKELFLKTNQAKKNEIMLSLQKSKQKIKQYWNNKQLFKNQTNRNQTLHYNNQIKNLQDRSVMLSDKEKLLLESLSKSQIQIMNQKISYEQLTGATSPKLRA